MVCAEGGHWVAILAEIEKEQKRNCPDRVVVGVFLKDSRDTLGGKPGTKVARIIEPTAAQVVHCYCHRDCPFGMRLPDETVQVIPWAECPWPLLAAGWQEFRPRPVEVYTKRGRKKLSNSRMCEQLIQPGFLAGHGD